MHRFCTAIALAIGLSGSADACPYAGFRDLEGQIADEVNKVFEGVTTSCSIARSADNRLLCSIACISLQDVTDDKALRSTWYAVIAKSAAKNIELAAAPDAFVTISMMDGHLMELNRSAEISMRSAMRLHQSGIGIKGWLKRIGKEISYHQFMSNKPMQPLD